MKRKKIKRQRDYKKIKIYVKYVLTVLFWLIFLYLFFFVDPNSFKNIYYLPFSLALFLASGASIYIFSKNTFYAIFISLGISLIVFLRLCGIKDYINPILIIGLVIALIYFFTVEKDSDKLKK